MKFDYEIFKTLLLTQHKLNIATSGDNYLTGYAKNGKEIDWELYIKMELAELVNSLPHKHWAKVTDEIDYANVKIELIDILHFTLSLIIKDSYDLYMQSADENSDEFNLEAFLELSNEDPDKKNIREALFDNDLDILEEAYKFIFDGTINIEKAMGREVYCEDHKTFCVSLFKNWFRILYYTNTGGHHLMFLLGAIEYLNTIDSIFSLEEAIAVYFGKGTLNLFRQNHGYKENTYVKIWTDTDGTKVEDNVIMMGLLTGISMFPGIDVASSNTIEKFQAELYSELEDYYTAMLESTVSADKEA